MGCAWGRSRSSEPGGQACLLRELLCLSQGKIQGAVLLLYGFRPWQHQIQTLGLLQLPGRRGWAKLDTAVATVLFFLPRCYFFGGRALKETPRTSPGDSDRTSVRWGLCSVQ